MKYSSPSCSTFVKPMVVNTTVSPSLSSVLINYILSQIYNFKISLSSVLVCALVVFITLEVPHRFITVHYNKKVEVEGTCLISHLNNKFSQSIS